MSAFFVSGIGTGVGKTIASAWLCHHLGATYWKPVQAGLAFPTDTELVRSLASLPDNRVLPEVYRLKMPASPHLAAADEGIRIEEERISIPRNTHTTLIIEGAGGLMVPLRDDLLYIDLVASWDIPVILVVQTYLGSINHSLLSLEALEKRGIPLAGIIVNEGEQPASSDIIIQRSGAPLLGIIPRLENISHQTLAGIPMLQKPVI